MAKARVAPVHTQILSKGLKAQFSIGVVQNGSSTSVLAKIKKVVKGEA